MLPVLAQAAFRWDVVTNNLDALLAGLALTVQLAAGAFATATVLGLVVALLRLAPNRAVGLALAAYVNVFRAIPLIVFIVFVHYGIAIAFDLGFSALQSGFIALTLQYSAWLGEIFRAGIQAVPKGQREASLSVGMGEPQTFLTITLPQAVRVVIPPTGNMLIGMLKDSALVYILGVGELFRTGQLLANRTFRYFEVYLAVVLLYLLLTTAVYYLVKYLERRFTTVDPLASRAQSWSPFVRRRVSRLRALQDTVRAGRQKRRSQDPDVYGAKAPG